MHPDRTSADPEAAEHDSVPPTPTVSYGGLSEPIGLTACIASPMMS